MTIPVNYKLAKLLNEKKFDRLCQNLWHFNGSDIVRTPNRNSEKFGFSAPTLGAVIMWLYEEHGIHIEILLSEDHPWNSFYYRVMKVGNYFTLSHNGDYRKSPTEAYESAIEYVLNNLI